MNYYETMVIANKYKINAIDFLIADEVNSQLGDTLMDVLDTDKEKKEKFERVCNLTWEVYNKTEEISIQHIVSTIIEILYDRVNTIDTITRKSVIEKL